MTGTVLILGGSGRFGRNSAEAFWNAGWQVRLFDRASDDLLDCAKDVDVIVHGWNPLAPQWRAEVPALTASVIAAAKVNNATVIIPGNVYVFGDQSGPILTETTPHRATNPMGKVRRELENAFQASGVRTIVLRAGDFIDTEASGNWFDRIMIASLDKSKLTYPGPTDVQHAWAYLPDLARAAVALANKRAELPAFTDVPFPGYALTGDQLASALGVVTGQNVVAKRMAWWPLALASSFWKMGRSLLEMRYLWKMPHHLDGARFEQLVPEFRATHLHAALADALPDARAPDQSVAIAAE